MSRGRMNQLVIKSRGSFESWEHPSVNQRGGPPQRAYHMESAINAQLSCPTNGQMIIFNSGRERDCPFQSAIDSHPPPSSLVRTSRKNIGGKKVGKKKREEKRKRPWHGLIVNWLQLIVTPSFIVRTSRKKTGGKSKGKKERPWHGLSVGNQSFQLVEQEVTAFLWTERAITH